MTKEQSKPTGVSLSPKHMVDSVSDWPLHQVIDYLKRKEKESPEKRDYSHITYRHGIRGLISVIDELGVRYGVSRGQMSRWLSYHAVFIARDDVLLSSLSSVYSGLRTSALGSRGFDVLDVLDSATPYSPKNREYVGRSLILYDPWVKSEFQELAQVCGVYTYSVIQLFLVRSILTADLSSLGFVVKEFQGESKRWDKWMGARLAQIKELVDDSSLDYTTTL